MHYLLIGYMFLFIDRPFEVWPIIGDLHIERIYILCTIGVWFLYPDKKFHSNFLHLAYAMFGCAILLCWIMSPWSEHGQFAVENWLKIAVFYVLLATSASDEKGLKRLVLGFMAVMGLYLLHSFREFLGGRHTYRMGIVRMIGVDTSLGDPNSFGASIVFALPFVVAFWKIYKEKWMRFLITGYLGLSVLCVLLTGSRGSLVGVVIWAMYLVLKSRYRWRALAAFCVLSPVIFLALPPSLQNRFETIIDSDVGPKNAKESGEGRIEGYIKGVELLERNPLTGIGPGVWRQATRSKIESHSLYAQLMGELGGMGIITFSLVVAGLIMNVRWIRQAQKRDPFAQSSAIYPIANAIGMGIFLLLFEGLFGHNLFRHNWLWYGAFLIIGRAIIETRLQAIPVTPYRVYSGRYRVQTPQAGFAYSR